MLIVLGIIFFYFNHQRSHVYQPIAVQLCKSHSHDTLRVLLEAVGSRGGGGTSICTRPNEIDVPPSISVGTAGEEAQHAGTQHITHNLMSWGLVKNVPLSVEANSISYCPYLSTLILLSFLTHAHIHRLIQSICCSPHVHILQAPQREFAMKSLPGKCQVHLRTDLSLQWREMVVCGETEAK